jgi:hypothetical protein
MRLEAHDPHACPRMARALLDPEVPVAYLAPYREFALLADDQVVGLLAFCPWCGDELPPSLRDRFYDDLERMGLEPDDDVLPVEYRTDDWWRLGAIG